jgi:hydrogenase expression/formation protein HypE
MGEKLNPNYEGYYSKVLLAHGSGGKLMHDLIRQIFLPQFRNPLLEQMADATLLDIEGIKLALTTDSYVVDPVFFPGGDIGKLAIFGTVNDLAMVGAKPLFLTVGFILEEGFELDKISKITCSMQEAAKAAQTLIVTGDTKVVEKGKADKIFINTAGIGKIITELGKHRIQVGDKIILNGPIGLHGIAIMSVRIGLEFDPEIESDTTPLNSLVETILDLQGQIHCLRDPTRGGVANTLNEIASQTKLGITIYEDRIPIPEKVAGACELLGLDPLYLANEGKFIAFVAPEDAARVLEIIQSHPHGKEAMIIGEVTSEPAGIVIMRTRFNTYRLVDMLSGEQLPRIC